MNIRRIFAPILILFVVVSCTTSSLYRREIKRLASTVNYRRKQRAKTSYLRKKVDKSGRTVTWNDSLY